MYYSSDPSIDTTVVGQEETAHALTYGCGESGSVFTPLALDIDPKNFFKSYTDAAGPNNAQGMIIVETVVGLDMSTLNSPVLGTVYCDYECEFTVPNLSYETPSRPSTYTEFNMTAVTGNVTQGRPFQARMNNSGISTPALYYAGFSVSTFPSGVTTAAQLQDWIMAVTIASPFVSATPANASVIPVYNPTLELNSVLSGGMTFHLRFVPVANSSDVVIKVYPNFQAAVEASPQNELEASPDDMQWRPVDWTVQAPATVMGNGLWHRIE